MAMLLKAAESPATLASSGQAIEISESISAFSKLSDALGRELEVLEPARRPANRGTETVEGHIRFDFADAQSDDVTAEVAVTARVPLVCQRCLEAMDAEIAAEARLLFVKDADAPGREGFESWELDQDLVRPIEVVDEMLVMALPFAAMHDDSDCTGAAVTDRPAARETIRPFADLRAQMDSASEPDDPAEK